jgi:mannosyltransferase
MGNSDVQPLPSRLPPAAIAMLTVLLAVGLAMRLLGVGREGLWLDEIHSASYANLSWFETIVACLRFDVHPPFYYLQLNAWSAVSHSDAWLMFNSVAFGMVTLVIVFAVTRRRYGTTAGLIALAFCAVMGSEVYFANELRPYTLLGLLMLLSWMAADRVRLDYRFRTALPLILLLVVIGGLHSFGVIAVSATLMYLLPTAGWRETRRLLPTWIAISAVAIFAVLPWLINASMRNVGHLQPISLSEISYTVSGWMLGYRAIAMPAWIQSVVATLLGLILILAMLLVPRLRRMIACFILWPLGLAALVCIVWKPIWLFRPFSFCAPFLAIAMGAVFGHLILSARNTAPRILRGSYLALIITALLGAAWVTYQQTITPWKTQYREAADYIREQAQAGDIVYIPDHVTFWGVARYLVGPEWGSVLKVQDPLDQDHSANWPRIYERLGAKKLQQLHLAPEQRRVDGFKAPLYIGWSPLPELRDAKVVWIAGSLHIPYDFRLEDVALCPYTSVETRDFTEVRIYHITCDAPAAPLTESTSS